MGDILHHLCITALPLVLSDPSFPTGRERGRGGDGLERGRGVVAFFSDRRRQAPHSLLRGPFLRSRRPTLLLPQAGLPQHFSLCTSPPHQFSLFQFLPPRPTGFVFTGDNWKGDYYLFKIHAKQSPSLPGPGRNSGLLERLVV